MRSSFKIIVILLFASVALQISNAQERVLFFQTNWGFTGSWNEFCEKAKTSEYDGVEVWVPQENKSIELLQHSLKKNKLEVIYICGVDRSLPIEEGIVKFKADLLKAISLKPMAINCHTGSDFFSVNENKAFIELAQQLSAEYSIPIYHETHRGRFSYTLPTALEMIEEIPLLPFTLDVSHWMVVHESLLFSEQERLNLILKNTHHIHARVGFEQAPQVNNPQAPEWDSTLQRHLDLWENIIQQRLDEKGFITITTEFGPPTYMPTEPFTQKPLSDLWETNVFIMNALKNRLK